MAESDTVEKIQQKIITVLARMLVLAPESIKADARYADLLHSDPSALRAFAMQIEAMLDVPLGDSSLDAYRTIAELAAHCAKLRPASSRGERRYVVLCQMPDGSTRERIYSARRHELAAEQAMDDGAVAVLSVEREDVEDRAPKSSSTLLKVLLPLIVGLALGAVVVAYFGWRQGYLKLW